MRKLKKLSLILLASAALLCGCTQSNIVSPSNGVVQGTDSLTWRLIKILTSTGRR